MIELKKYKLEELLELQRGYDLTSSQMKGGDVAVAGSNGIIGYHDVERGNHPCITVGRSGSIGKVHYYEQPVWAHNTALYVKDFKGNNPKYLFYFLKNLHLDELFGNGSSVVPSLDRKVVHAMLVPFNKDRDQQDKIANLLSRIDRKISLNRAINRNLEALAKQLYDYWFVQFDFPDENGKPYKSSGGKMVWNEVLKREIPEGWEVKPLNSWLEIKSGFAFKSESYQSSGTYKIITIKNVQENHLDTSGCDYISQLPDGIKDWCVLRLGDRLISLTGNCGRLCVVTEKDLLLNQRVGLLYCDTNKKEFAYRLLCSSEFQTICSNLAKGAAQANLSPVELCTQYSVFPPEKVLSAFNSRLEPFTELYTNNEQQIVLFTCQRDELLPLLMNGQVTIE